MGYIKTLAIMDENQEIECPICNTPMQVAKS